MKLSGLFRRKWPVLLALSTLGLPGAAWSALDGEIEPVNGTYDYLINISNHDITSNQAGATITDEFNLAGMFQGVRTVHSQWWISRCITCLRRR